MDSLKFGINYDLEEGLEKAKQDWTKVEKKLQGMIGKSSMKIKLGIPTEKEITTLEGVAKRLKELKIEPINPETRNAIRTLVRELKNMEKILVKIDRLNKTSKVPVSVARVNQINATTIQREALAQQKLNKAKTDAIWAEERLAQSKIKTTHAELRLSEAQRKAELAQKKAIATTKKQTSAYRSQANTLGSLKRMVSTYIGVFAIARVVTKIREITGEFEMQRVALGAIIQDKGRADALFSQIQATALESPFSIKELVTFTKELAAYRVETELLFDTTMRLADISAGLGVEMSRLVLAYGQVKAAAVLRGQELRQFTEAGIPLVQLLAQKFSALNGRVVETGEVFELISERAVSFELVKEIFEDMTNEGGMFYDMQRIQSKTLQGSWANLKDAADVAFDSIGRSQYGVIKGTIDGAKTILANWSTVESGLWSLVGTYGVYQIALAVTAGVQSAFSKSMLVSTAATGGLRGGIAKLIISLKALWAAIRANPILAAISAITAIAGAIWTFTTASRDAQKAQEELTLTMVQETTAVNDLLNKLQDANITGKEREQVMSRLAGYSSELAEKIAVETAALKDNEEVMRAIVEIQKEYNELRGQAFNIQRFSADEGLDDAVLEFQKVEGQLRDAQYKATESYNNFVNIWEQVIRRDTGFNISSNVRKEVEAIMESNKQAYEKAAELQKYYNDKYKKEEVSTALYRRNVKISFNQLETEDYLESQTKYRRANNMMRREVKQLADFILKSNGMTSESFLEAGDDVKKSMNNIINSVGSLPEATKKDIIIAVGVEMPKKEAERNLLQTIVGDIFEQTHGELKGLTVQSRLPQPEDNLSTFISDKKKEYKELVELIKQEKQLRESLGTGSMTDEIFAMKNATLEQLKAEAKAMGFSLEDAKKGNAAKKTKLDMLKEEISLVQDAYTRYEKLALVVGKAEAKSKLEDLFGGQLKFLDLAFDEQQMKEVSLSFLDKIKGLTGSDKEKFDIALKLSDISIARIEKDVKDILDKVKLEIDEEQSKLDYFNAIFEATGSEEKATEMTQRFFGAIEDVATLRKDTISKLLLDALVPKDEIDKMINDNVVDWQKVIEKAEELPEVYKKAVLEIAKENNAISAKTRKEFLEALKNEETFEERRLAIKRRYDKLREQAENESERRSISNKEGKEISALSIEEFKASKDWAKAFGDLEKVSTATLQNIKVKIEEIIATDKNLTPENLKSLSELLIKIEEGMDMRNPFKSITEGLKEYAKAVLELKKARESGDLTAEREDEILSRKTTAYKKVQSGIDKVSKAVSEMQTLIGELVKVLGLAKDSEMAAYMMEFEKALGYVATALGVVATAATLADTALAPLIAATIVIAGLVALGSWILGKDVRDANKEIKRQGVLLGELERAYGKLQKASEKAFGIEWMRISQQEMENLEAQMAAYEAQLEAEMDKGKDKSEEEIAKYQALIEDILDQIAEFNERVVEKFTGTDLSSFAREFAKSWLEAYIAIGRQGAITTDELKNQWKSLIKNMLVESFIASAVQGAFQGTFDRITEMYSNGKIPTAQEINDLSEQGALTVDILANTLPQLLEGINLSELVDASSELSGLSKSISGITEEQANVLSATMNTQNFYLFTVMSDRKSVV